ncbi:MAG: hypothetical protein AAF512_16840 [Pseudomonadota bacterium]
MPDDFQQLSQLAQSLPVTAPVSLDSGGKLTAILESLRFDYLYDVLIMGEQPQFSLVSSVCMLPDGTGLWLYSNADRIWAFTPGEAPRIDDVHWKHRFTTGEHSHDMLPPRALYAIDENRVLVIGGRSIGIAVKGEAAVRWQFIAPSPIRTAALQNNRVVVGGEWQYDPENEATNELLYAFYIEGEQLLYQPGLFPPPTAWRAPLALRGLAWDKAGDLWGVSWGEGYLLHWPAAWKNPVYAQTVKTLNSNQHTLLVHQDLILSGGEDGIVRAFRRTGEIAWHFLAGGTIRGLGTVEGIPGLAVLSENEHIYLLNESGHFVSAVSFPNNRRPMAMASHNHHDRARYFIGTLKGGVRLVESLPLDTIKPEYDPLPEDALNQQIAAHCKTLADDKALLLEWCSLSGMTDEPMRAAWALRQLLLRHRDFKAALTTLRTLREHFDPSIPSLLQFRADALGSLGRVLPELPADDAEEALKVCQWVYDGSLSRLLTGLPTDCELYSPILMRAVLDKLRRQRHFTSTALLAIAHRPAMRRNFEQLWLLLLHQPAQVGSFRPGLLEGLLGIVLNTLGLENGLIAALSRLSEVYPRLARQLLNVEPHATQFQHWLDSCVPVLLNSDMQAAWQALSQPRPTPLPNHQSADSIQLQAIAHCFPDVADTMQHPLPDSWQPLAQLSHRLRNLRIQMLSGRLAAPAIKVILQQHDDELLRFQPNLPLLTTLQQTWKNAWLAELGQLRTDSLPSHPVEYPRVDIEPLLVVEGEPAPLTIMIRNYGPDDIHNLSMWLDTNTSRRIPPEAPKRLENIDLPCAREGQFAPAVLLRTFLLPPHRPLSVTVHWQIESREANWSFDLTPQPRWSDYARQYPQQDQWAARLFSEKHAGEFRYYRIIVRIWPHFAECPRPRELTALVQHWAERAGRIDSLKLLTPALRWPGATSFPSDQWRRLLQTPADGLEVWLVDDTLPWHLAFLASARATPATALLLPQFSVAGQSLKTAMTEMLDEIISQHDQG